MTPQNEMASASTDATSDLAAGQPLSQSDYPTKASEVLRLAERESYVVRVVSTLSNGMVKCQHYASLHAAVKAEERARARGCDAVLSLARVVPVGIITADELAILRGDLL